MHSKIVSQVKERDFTRNRARMRERDRARGKAKRNVGGEEQPRGRERS